MARVRSNGKFKGRLTKPKYSVVMVESYRKYTRSIARVFINFMKTDQAEVVNDNGRKLPKVPPKYCDSFD